MRLFCLDVLMLVEIDVLCSTCKYILPINDIDFHCRVNAILGKKNCNILIRSTAYFGEKKSN